MGRFENGASTALVIFLLLILPAPVGFAAPRVMAQTETQTAPAAGSPSASDAKPGSTSQAPATTDAPVSAPATKSALSITACSVKYLEAKVADKLQGRKWVDFRRDKC